MNNVTGEILNEIFQKIKIKTRINTYLMETENKI
jgi:hypothetical protein